MKLNIWSLTKALYKS